MARYPQTATYWAPGSKNTRQEITYDSPSEKKVRWEDKAETFFDAQIGGETTSQSIVYVQEDLEVNGFLYLGSSTETNPDSLTGAYVIKTIEKVGSVRGDKYIRKIYL